MFENTQPTEQAAKTTAKSDVVQIAPGITTSRSFLQAEARILASMQLGEVSITDGQEMIGELERESQKNSSSHVFVAAREIGLPDCGELATKPLAALDTRISAAFEKQVEYIARHRDGVPPLMLHGTSKEGLAEMTTNGPRDGKLWFAELSYQSEDPRIFSNDLLNIARKAGSYSSGNEGMAVNEGGVLILSGSKPEQELKRLRSSLNDDYNLSSQYGTGAFAERVYKPVSIDDFKRDLIGSVAWKDTPFSFADFIGKLDLNDPGNYLRREVFDSARAIYLMHAILRMIEPEINKFGIHKPVAVFEERHGATLLKAEIDHETHYTYPDGVKVIKGVDGVRQS